MLAVLIPASRFGVHMRSRKIIRDTPSDVAKHVDTVY
jgi:hypothetical protein